MTFLVDLKCVPVTYPWQRTGRLFALVLHLLKTFCTLVDSPCPPSLLGSDASTQMVESNASLYLGEEMFELHQESLETFFHDGGNDEGAGIAGGGGGVGPDSPGAKTDSDSDTLAVDTRPSGASAQVCLSVALVVDFSTRKL